jgi:hypothetical protein
MIFVLKKICYFFRKNVVCPIIDVINDRTFAYQKGIELFRGGFNWNLQFRWYAVPPKISRERASDPAAPIASPTMAGGLFSIDRQYFEELGTYDMGFDIWASVILFSRPIFIYSRGVKTLKLAFEFGNVEAD